MSFNIFTGPCKNIYNFITKADILSTKCNFLLSYCAFATLTKTEVA